MKIGGVGNLCLWCMEEMGETSCCPHCGHDEREPMKTEQAVSAGKIIGGGHYLVGRALGQGGFGITYLAYDLNLHIKRAIKEFFPQGLVTRVEDSVQVTRQSITDIYLKGVDSFYREAQSIACFSGHPNVVQVHAFFRENNTAYFVMDYVEGISFQQYLDERGGRISWEEALHILKPIGEALTALHEEHLLHRDVKPANIYITNKGIPKLLDFGAARYETSESTHSSSAVLTPGYAPMEQYGSMSQQGTFTDVYALAATFYRAVSGIVPIPSPDRIVTDLLVPLDKLDGRVPAQVSQALTHGMSVRREKRTQSVEELLEELEKSEKPSFLKWLLPAVIAVLVLGVSLGVLGVIPHSNSGLKDGRGETRVLTLETTVDIPAETASLALTMGKASEIPTATPEPTANGTLEAIVFRETSLAETQAAILSEREKRFEETEAAFVLTMVKASEIPTATPEPTANGTLESIVFRETALAATQSAWAAQQQTEAARPTNTPVQKATSTPEPTHTAVPVQNVITDSIRNAKVGSHVYFGHYEQDNDKKNGKEAIEWRVLERYNNGLLLLSEYGLDTKPYNDKTKEVTWETCTLRTWLNGDFYKAAFSAEEQKHIAATSVKAEKNPYYPRVSPGNDTQDKVFLLSFEEANIQRENAYFTNYNSRLCYATAYAKAKGAYIHSKYGTGWWWLRTPGDGKEDAAYVRSTGPVNHNGHAVYGSGGRSGLVRPVIHLTF